MFIAPHVLKLHMSHSIFEDFICLPNCETNYGKSSFIWMPLWFSV